MVDRQYQSNKMILLPYSSRCISDLKYHMSAFTRADGVNYWDPEAEGPEYWALTCFQFMESIDFPQDFSKLSNTVAIVI